jgi:hypothetical protein
VQKIPNTFAAGWKVTKKEETKKGGNDAAENNEAKLQKEREDLIKKTKEKVNKRIQDARAKDDSKLREEVEDLLQKFRSNKRRMWQRPPIHYLDDLFVSQSWDGWNVLKSAIARVEKSFEKRSSLSHVCFSVVS